MNDASRDTSTDLRPVRLRCEHLAAPRGLNTDRPRMGWALDGAGGRMIAWRIVAGRDRAAVRTGRGDLWDSGKCPARDDRLVDWGGAPLPSDLRLWWSVQVWDEAGRVSDLAEPAEIFTGLTPDDWRAEWIARYFVLPAGREVPQDNTYDNRFQARPADYLRCEADLPAAPVRATAYVSALGLYELHVNGTRIGEDVMAPGWTDYHTRVEYQVHDVTTALHAGPNCIGAILGEGWYSGRIGHNQRRAGNHYGGRPAFLCQIHLDFADGTTRILRTDQTWQTRQGPICYSDFLVGEHYDARLELGDWSRPGHGTRGWQPVECIVPEPGLPGLDAARIQPTREVARFAPKRITAAPDGTRIIDFGQNLAGYCEMTVEAPAGTVFRLRHGERLTEDGALYTENLRFAVSEDIYVAKGGGPETFKPRFTFHGFQYVSLTVEGDAADPQLTAIAIQTDLPMASGLQTGHPMVNQLLSNIEWGQRGNFLAVPTDCPQRDERYGWTADAQVFWRTAGFFGDVSAMLTKWMEDLIDGQSPDGAFPDVAPTKPLNPYRLTPQPGAPAWGDGPIIMAWHHWLRYGDRDLLERCWAPFTAWMDYIARHNPGRIRRHAVNNNYGDWLSVGPETDRALLATAYWANLADLMARIAGVTNRDPAPWQTLAAELRQAFRAAFWDKGRLAGDTQTAYLLALDFDLLDPGDRAAAAARLVALIDDAGGHLQTGFIGVRHLCPVLADNGYPEKAVSLLLKDSYPSWGFSIRHGATTIWERWDGWTPERGFQSTAMNSFNHYSYGAVGEFIWSRLAGIDWDPDAPGFARVVMRPIFDPRIAEVTATHAAHSGDIFSAWKIDGEEVRWTVALPPGVTARVTLPTGMALNAKAPAETFDLTPGRHEMTIRTDCGITAIKDKT
ncbi:alpha-L-rhamnosidase [Salipiger sp. IMCC34102]|uniref:alpha-L-rhamnosidase n=1 Tax=Salipiger sp. IMCC34102 TaxID=2510647 RepID=UPI00101D201E|nr:alpha-L-rhamnosidase [Salipiger sp. IMCC34102]RYH00944.1 alpha-L-rhamnosidase [Salipiger sp. IMCC34102]